MGPNPNHIYPNKNIKQIVYIKNVITRSNIVVGEYTYYDVRPCNYILDIHNLLDVFVWINVIRIWSHKLTLSNSYLFNCSTYSSFLNCVYLHYNLPSHPKQYKVVIPTRHFQLKITNRVLRPIWVCDNQIGFHRIQAPGYAFDGGIIAFLIDHEILHRHPHHP